MKQQVINGLKIIVIGLVLSAGISYAGSWVAPAGPPPGNNAQGPVNVGTTNQIKNSGLGLNSLAVFGGSLLVGDTTVGDYTTDPGTGTLKVATLQHTNSGDTHVCAQSNGTLYLCGVTTSTSECSDGVDNDSDGLVDYPNDPGCTSSSDNSESNVVNTTKYQTYSINSSGSQISSGDCSSPLGSCSNNIFITPVKYVAGSLRVSINGAGGGGGGGLAYQFSQGNNLSTGCSGTSGAPGTINDAGPQAAKCQINSGGGGGGGGAYSEFNSIGTQLSLQYSVQVGAGGSAGTKKGYGVSGSFYGSPSGWVSSILNFNSPPSGYGASDGQNGGESKVIGPLPQSTVVAQAEGGKGGLGGKIIVNPHTPSSSTGTGAGGTGGSFTVGANVQNGVAGASGKYTAWPYLIDTSTGDLLSYGSVVHSGSTSGNGGLGGNASSFNDDGSRDAGKGGVGSISCTSGGISSGGGGAGAVNPFLPNLGSGCKGGNGIVIFSWQETP